MNLRSALACVMLLAGCATQPPAPAPTPPPAADAAELYIFNDSGWTLMPGNQTVTDNGQAIASLPRHTYARVSIARGPHVLRPEPFLWKQEVILNAEPARSYYVVVAYNPERSLGLGLGVAGAPLVLAQLTAEQAAPLLKEMSRQ